MFVWQTLVATPVRIRSRRHVSSPRSVRAKTSFLPAPLVADDLAAFDGNQRRRVADLPQLGARLCR